MWQLWFPIHKLAAHAALQDGREHRGRAHARGRGRARGRCLARVSPPAQSLGSVGVALQAPGQECQVGSCPRFQRTDWTLNHAACHKGMSHSHQDCLNLIAGLLIKVFPLNQHRQGGAKVGLQFLWKIIQ